MNRILETGMKILFLIAACTSVIAVALICVFLFANGVPAMREIGVWDFLSGQLWRPANNISVSYTHLDVYKRQPGYLPQLALRGKEGGHHDLGDLGRCP